MIFNFNIEREYEERLKTLTALPMSENKAL